MMSIKMSIIMVMEVVMLVKANTITSIMMILIMKIKVIMIVMLMMTRMMVFAAARSMTWSRYGAE